MGEKPGLEPSAKGELEEKPPLKINIAPVDGMVHVTLSEAVKEFDVEPYAAISIATSLQDASVIARVNEILARREEEKTNL